MYEKAGSLRGQGELAGDAIMTVLGGGVAKKGIDVLKGGTKAVNAAADAGKSVVKHPYKYHDRVKMRALEDRPAHNFPYSFDDEILKTQPILRDDGYKIYQLEGELNGKKGVFEIGILPDGVIDHRFFRPTIVKVTK